MASSSSTTALWADKTENSRDADSNATARLTVVTGSDNENSQTENSMAPNLKHQP
jgi:hypothetical protein